MPSKLSLHAYGVNKSFNEIVNENVRYQTKTPVRLFVKGSVKVKWKGDTLDLSKKSFIWCPIWWYTKTLEIYYNLNVIKFYF